MYITRHLTQALLAALRQFPSLLVTGPRQSGKTTLLKTELGDGYAYVTFDDPLAREFARNDPRGFLRSRAPKPVILDEIQYVPELFQYLKMEIDTARDAAGRWVLTGSQQFSVMKNVTESLAGRIALLELLPFSLAEYLTADHTLEDVIWNGQYPEPALAPEKRELWIRSYIQTYIERDIRLLHNVQDLRLFETFVALCAARQAQEFNKATVARECGVSEHTANAWAGLLQATYIIALLPPFFRNFGKRIVKTPKLYFLDSGIVCSLTRQPSAPAALSGAAGGALFEGLIVAEALKVYSNHGKRPNLFFWRSHDGLEIDLLIHENDTIYPVEIKLTATPTVKHAEALARFKTFAQLDAARTQGIVVCRVAKETPLPHNNLALPYQQFSAWLSGVIAGRGRA